MKVAPRERGNMALYVGEASTYVSERLIHQNSIETPDSVTQLL